VLFGIGLLLSRAVNGRSFFAGYITDDPQRRQPLRLRA